MLQKGVGLERNLTASHGWLLRAAEAGNRNAMAELALIYDVGLGVPSSDEEARRWRDLAAGEKK